ncbi:MAG: sigma-70 family RNA polymerase sigma factor [Burkholderiales bacterium]|nr:sigma-70 family RNA polymerase sigma factor [Burkholderiales bacterium]
MAELCVASRESVRPLEVRRSGISGAALVALRPDMLRFAQWQAHDCALAEDIVQEAISAALRGSSAFAGRSSLKTWVFAILRNGIVDHLRKASRSFNLSSLAAEGADLDDCLDGLFNTQGAWREDMRPATWPSPDEAMQSRQFWTVLEACLRTLPAQTSRVFVMREVLGLEPRESSERLGISTGNCHVVLHRARRKRRACLEAGWGRDRPVRPAACGQAYRLAEA